MPHGSGAETGELHRQESLVEIKRLIDEHGQADYAGWSRQTARLYAIDVATVMTRRYLPSLFEADRRLLLTKLNQARRLVVDHLDQELERIQTELEARLGPGSAPQTRPLWLTAVNSMLPSPYRAAVATVTAALTLHPAEVDALSVSFRERLWARLEEGVPVEENADDLMIIA